MQLLPEHGVWYGLAFDTVLFGGLTLFFYVTGRTRRALRRKQAPISPQALGRMRARLKRLTRPTWLLVPARQPGFSKLGGDPELPRGLEGPRGAESREFLAQVDLSTLRANGGPDWLPTEGRIYAFFDPDGYGAADVVQILYTDQPPGPATAPSGRRYRERRVAFMEFTSIPSLDWLGMDAAEFGLDYETFQSSIADLADAPPDEEVQHRIGGYPNEIQDECLRLLSEHLARGLPPPVYGVEVPDAIDRASRQWQMLLQIDSDPDLGMNFGDGGRLYVFIREQHARKGDFSKTVALWQTY